EDVLLENSPLSLSRRGKKINGGDWSKPGAITEDILSAVRRLSENNYNGDIRVVASFDAYNLLFKVSERFPEAEMRNLHKIVRNVYFSSSLKGKKIIVYSMDDIYCLVRREPETILLDETAELKNYVIISEITPLVYSPEGCFVISPEK
ncbi:MAG: encapsulin, partial [Candidatus Thermoplasmatota archaeon]|nr:encapsulin [Candidatus Thermoplasmatota archaeon]